MGEVYRAHDPRLERSIAIKVLPPEASSDSSRLRRFEHEARAVGKLSHPNVLVVYDVGREEGSPYLVTELLEGETLRQRLRAGALSVRKVLDHGVQIARGLAAAHERDLVHRDLKPENVFLTKDGVVKILDFGLAQLLGRGLGPEDRELPTVTRQTAPGTVMGTVGYMAPEQVRGETADPRSDLFALGAVLFEMLSGRRAFEGEGSVETLNAILHDEPPELPADRHAPPALDRIVRHCLEKRPEERVQSARDLAFDLEGLQVASGIGSGPAAVLPVRHWRRLLGGTLAAVVLAVALGGVFVLGRRTPDREIPSYRQITFRRGFASSGRFTPDGQTVVYSAAWDGGPPEIYSTRVDAPESRSLGLPPGHVAAVSSKGELAMVLTDYPVSGRRGTLARVPLSGGTPRPVAEGVSGADWAPDGEGLAVERRVGQERLVEFPLGTVLGRGEAPRFSPRGDRLAFGTAEGYQILELASGRSFTITGVPERYHSFYWDWSPDGEEIWFTASDAEEDRPLEAVSLLGHRRVLDQIAGAASLFDVSRQGLALIEHAYARWHVRARRPGETTERDLSIFDRTQVTDLSADGRTLLLWGFGAAERARDVAYLRRANGAAAMRLGEGVPLALSPDGSQILLRQSDQLLIVPAGAGEERAVPHEGLQPLWADWTPDGGGLFVFGAEEGRGRQVFLLDPGSGKRRALTPEGVGDRFSRNNPGPVPCDGRRVAFAGPNGRVTLYPLEGGEAREVPGLEPGIIPLRFADEGRTLFVSSSDAARARVWRVELSTGRRTLVHELGPPDAAGVTPDGFSLVTPDGRGYAYTYRQILHQLYLVEGLR